MTSISFITAFRFAVREILWVFRSYPGLILFLGVYAAARVLLNRSIGISWGNTLRPLAMGLLFQTLLILLIETIYLWRFQLQREEKALDGLQTQPNQLAALVLLLTVWLFWAADIVDGLQRTGAMPGEPILNILPGWTILLQLLENLGEQVYLMLPFLPAGAYASLFSNILLRLTLPYCILRLLGAGFANSGPTFRRWEIVAPFLLAGFTAWSAQGVSLKNIAVLGIVALYPGLTEELFYRGWLQPQLRVWLRPGYAILLTAIIFGLLHLPEYIFVRYTAALPLAFSNLADVILDGVVRGYGVYRTRSVLPWAVYHSLTDLVGF